MAKLTKSEQSLAKVVEKVIDEIEFACCEVEQNVANIKKKLQQCYIDNDVIEDELEEILEQVATIRYHI